MDLTGTPAKTRDTPWGARILIALVAVLFLLVVLA